MGRDDDEEEKDEEEERKPASASTAGRINDPSAVVAECVIRRWDALAFG